MSASYRTCVRRAARKTGRRTSRRAFVAMRRGMMYTHGPRAARSPRSIGSPGIWTTPDMRNRAAITIAVMVTQRNARAFRQPETFTERVYRCSIYIRPVSKLSRVKGPAVDGHEAGVYGRPRDRGSRAHEDLRGHPCGGRDRLRGRAWADLLAPGAEWRGEDDDRRHPRGLATPHGRG